MSIVILVCLLSHALGLLATSPSLSIFTHDVILNLAFLWTVHFFVNLLSVLKDRNILSWVQYRIVTWGYCYTPITHTHTVEQVSYVLCNIVIDQPGEHEQDMLIFD